MTLPKVNWRACERLAWLPKEDREAAIESASTMIKTITWELDAIREKIDMARTLLAMQFPQDRCVCGNIMPKMPGGGDGQAKT